MKRKLFAAYIIYLVFQASGCLFGTEDDSAALAEIGIHNTGIVNPILYPDSCGQDTSKVDSIRWAKP